MGSVFLLLLRRLRAPLIVLTLVYSVSIIGLVLIPGVDDTGQPHSMSFFHAFYFVSYMGSTIGFGEIPHAFTSAQRMWTSFAIYATVFAWLYAIGALLAITQDRSFWRQVSRIVFSRAVRRIAEPFYIICGYGDTGTLLVSALSERGIRCVVIDRSQERIDALEIEGITVDVPGLCADCTDVEVLRSAGLVNPLCRGVLAMTNSDHANLSVAIASKLLLPAIEVIARAEFHDTEANLQSFGTEHVINPFDSFADRFAMAIRSPAMYLIHEWMTSSDRDSAVRAISPPRGTWIICGYGRFGKALETFLSFEGVRTVIIEANPESTNAPSEAVRGRGTEAVTLEEAGVREAVGIIAGTDNDANNLSIIITARDLHEDIFSVARQNQQPNDRLFEAAWLNLAMQPGAIIVRRVLAYISTPLLDEFLRLVRDKDDEWCNILASRIVGIVGENIPDTWTLTIDGEDAPGAAHALSLGERVLLGDLMVDPAARERHLQAIPLLLSRGDELQLLPEVDQALKPDDRLLFCGEYLTGLRLTHTARNYNRLIYAQTGVDRPNGWIWRWLANRGARSGA